MPTTPTNAPAWAALIPLVVIALVILRNSRARRLRIEGLWVSPVIILVLVGLSFSQQAIPTPLMLGIDIAALVVGAALGWWRARFTTITVDPATHELTSRASALGMLVILGVFAVRYAVRMYATQSASSLGVSANGIADAALVISVGLVCAQRLEIALRATRLLNEARAARPAA
ncbi:MAG TPA: hypothetical protein VHN39_01960 [Phenylobacterium sp.]|jgi:hypothetical protein|nr:hypothetical protein [Phenylobacterium sp.]